MPDPLLADLRALATACSALADETATKTGLSHGARRALEEIVRHPGITPGELAKRVRVSTGAVSDILDRLEARGYVTREMGKDRRFRRVTATPLGVEFDERAWAVVAAALGGVLARYRADELGVILGFLGDARECVRRARG
jgi:DNA-binding MarR family transcriptional regulator